VLGLLAERPMSGYDLTKHFDESLAGAWSARHSQIYPELARLQEAGLIRVAEEGPRGRKRYTVTEAGLKEVRRWLVATEPDRTSRSEAYMRVFLLWLVEPTDAHEYLRRQAEFHDQNLTRMESQVAALGETTPAERWTRIGLEAGIRHERTLLQWTQWAMGEIRRDLARRRAIERRQAAEADRAAVRPPEPTLPPPAEDQVAPAGL
jgi:DNA-binding PadR family transcriptional regulator